MPIRAEDTSIIREESTMTKIRIRVIVFALIVTAILALAATASADVVNWSYDASTDTLTISGSGYMSGYSGSSTPGGGSNAPWQEYYRTRMKKVVVE